MHKEKVNGDDKRWDGEMGEGEWGGKQVSSGRQKSVANGNGKMLGIVKHFIFHRWELHYQFVLELFFSQTGMVKVPYQCHLQDTESVLIPNFVYPYGKNSTIAFRFLFQDYGKHHPNY